MRRPAAPSLSVKIAASALLAATSLVAAAPMAGAAKGDFTTGKPNQAPIFFSSDTATDEGVLQIFKIGPQGGQPTRLTVAGTTDTDPSVNRDRTLVAFAATERVLYAKSRIEIMSADGSQRRTVASDPNANLRDPSLSPDGTRIVYTRQAGTDQQIWVVNTDGTNRYALTTATDGKNRQPVWSPDGKMIAFTTERHGLNDIWMMSASGQGAQRVSYEGMGVADPAWSPNGRSIAYSYLDPQTKDSEVQWVDAYSVNVVHKVSNNPSGADRDPSWTPDGKRIVFTSTSGGSQRLISATISGTEPKVLTDAGRTSGDADCGYPNYAAMQRA